MSRAGEWAWWFLAIFWLVSACGAPRTFLSDPGSYDRVPDAWIGDLQKARLAFERGDAHGAHEIVLRLTEEGPRVIPVRTFLQDIELHLLESEGHLGSMAAANEAEARSVLAQHYEDMAEGSVEAEGFVLAARLCSDGEQALALLEEADTIDSSCVWVQYGRAWWRYVMRRFKEARQSLLQAFRLDGGHLPSLRLHATLLAGAGDSEPAAAALEVWLSRTARNPLFSAAERADALLDLAALHVLLDEPKKALDLLDTLDPRAVRDPVRVEGVRATAFEARGLLTEALEAVHRAGQLSPDALLPIVQQAMLLQKAGDVEGERKAWLRLLEVTGQSEVELESEDLSAIDFEGVLFGLQARARLERLSAEP